MEPIHSVEYELTGELAMEVQRCLLRWELRRGRIEFAEERIRRETEFFRGEGAWTELDDVVVFDGFWVLHLSNGGQVVIPQRLVSPELEAFICAKAQRVTAPVLLG